MENLTALRPLPEVDAAPSLWFDRLDVDRLRSFRPLVSVPHVGDSHLRRASDVLDRTVTRPLSSVLLAGSLPTIFGGFTNPRRLEEVWGFYADPAFLQDPSLFFEAPGDAFTPARRVADDATFKPGDGDVWDLFFASPFEPVNPAVRRDYLGHHDNRLAHARYWRHESGPRKTVICVHGYMASNHLLNTELFNVRWLYQRGLDVLLFCLPFHGDRATVAPGFAFPGFDMARMAEGFAHAVHDLRVFIGWLLGQGAPAVGMMGASLGGYTTALMAGLDERLDFAVPMIPATSLVDTVLDWSPANVVLSALLKRVGLEPDDVRAFAAVHTPLQHDPLVPRDRLLVIGADGDMITRPYQARLLWEHWGGPQVHWYAGSHVIHVHRATYLRRLGRFLGDIGVFAPRD